MFADMEPDILEVRIKNLEAKLTKAREVLGYYANQDNWIDGYIDMGSQARTVLQEVEE